MWEGTTTFSFHWLIHCWGRGMKVWAPGKVNCNYPQWRNKALWERDEHNWFVMDISWIYEILSITYLENCLLKNKVPCHKDKLANHPFSSLASLPLSSVREKVRIYKREIANEPDPERCFWRSRIYLYVLSTEGHKAQLQRNKGQSESSAQNNSCLL